MVPSLAFFCISSILLYLNHIIFVIAAAASETTSPYYSNRSTLTDAQSIELSILTALYHGSSGSTWTVSSYWLGDVSHCNWFGITCSENNHVSKIELSNNNLNGSVPLRALLRLPYLKVLKISGNAIDSNLVDGPDAMLWEGVVFDEIASPSTSAASSLQYIDLSNTDVLSGKLSNLYSPSYIINPDQSSSPVTEKELSYPYLNDLYLSGCTLRSAPTENEWFLFEALERFVLDDNMMSGTISTDLRMSNLRVFSANGNKLSGLLDGFGSMDKLRHLSVRGNQFHGYIPKGLKCDGNSNGGAKSLEILDLSYQSGKNSDGSIGLIGELPSFSQCENLRRLDLSRNSIGGTFPVDFLNSIDPLVFEGAMLNSNRIGGVLPSSLSRLDSDAVAVQDNRISGLDEELLCDSSRSGSIAAFGCDAVLCPPGKFRPGTGRQEEKGEGCETCDTAEFWGAVSCSQQSAEAITGGAPPPTKIPSDEEASSEEEQKTILMQLFEATGGRSWKHNSGWMRHDSISICDWYGVECSFETKLVERLDLQSNNLHGRVPSSIFHILSLKILLLKDNMIFQTKRDAIDFFKDIDRAVQLETLDVGSTGLSTVTGIEHAPKLTELHLDSNLFSSTVPTEIFSLRKLKTLTMDSCSLTGKVDNSIHQLSKLVLLSASNNLLTGNLPPEISYLSSLSTLRLNNNKLSGTIPQSYNLLAELTSLDLSGQKRDRNKGLEGPLREFSQSPKLKRVDLSTNSFSGPVPGFFLASVDPDTFEFADLSDNLLVSSFPVGLSPIADKVYLQLNRISSIEDICSVALKGSDFESLGCDAFLCSPGTYASLGRSTSSDDPCLHCPERTSAQYYGSVTCNDQEILPTSQEDAIKLIYSSCGGPDWNSHTNWLSDNVPICKWEGITCSQNGSITELSLRSNGLSCAFPLKEVLEVLSDLNALALEGNDVSFDFSQINGSPSLTSLDITNTNTQTLDGIENLNSLSELYASSNDFKGSVFPKKVLQLSYLERLDLSFNSLVGNLPNDIGFGLKRMKVLSLGHNSLTGNLPSSIGQMTSLQYLDMEANQLTGGIPDEVLSLTELQSINLSNQKGTGLTGGLPRFSSYVLESLDLSGNAFSGPVPSNFLSNIDNDDLALDLSSNQLTGELPETLSRLALPNIDFSDNKITAGLCGDDCAMVLCAPTTYSESGRQPSKDEYCKHCSGAIYWGATFCHGSTPTRQPVSVSAFEGASSTGVSVSEADIDKIKLIYESCGGDSWIHNDNWMSSQTICSWYGIECNDDNAVVSIILSANNLKGVFPPNIFFLPHLQTLALDSNDLQFSFSSIEYATKLSTFDLSDTGLFKLDGIQDAPALSSLDISGNDFKTFPLEVLKIARLQELFMGSNDFQTSLPTQIADLKELKLMSCASCNLQGELPYSIGKLTNLVHLNLEDNTITGTLPTEMEALENLAFLDLSGQSLHGQLLSFKTLRDLRRLDLSKNSFSGTVPEEFLSGINPIFFDYLDLSENFLTGTVPNILARFNRVSLQENQFIAIDDSLCDKSRGGAIKQFGCDAVLCPSNTYNVIGRQDSELNACEHCPGSMYYGATSCNSTASPISIDDLELLQSDVVKEKQGLSIFYQKCGGNYWTSNTHWMDNRLSHCHWKGIQCYNGTKTVKSIDLGSNNVLGTPPLELFKLLPNLKTLHLNSNPLTSFNFQWLEYATRLTDLNLDATGLKSLDGIQFTSALRLLSLRSNHLSGPFPLALFHVKTLTSLILGHNDLSGPIPSSFEKLPFLETLIVNDNHLTGRVEDMTFPRTIKLLDISKNKLTGSIPSSFLHNIPSSVQIGVDLTDNLISSIDNSICTKSNFNRGDVEQYGCNGLLCPIEYYSNTGRHSSLGECIYCPNVRYLGSTECLDEGGYGTSKWTAIIFIVVTITLVAFLLLARRIKQAREFELQNEDVESLILESNAELT